jgi:hypothetical protein
LKELSDYYYDMLMMIHADDADDDDDDGDDDDHDECRSLHSDFLCRREDSWKSVENLKLKI